jgi:hypothetical protein
MHFGYRPNAKTRSARELQHVGGEPEHKPESSEKMFEGRPTKKVRIETGRERGVARADEVDPVRLKQTSETPTRPMRASQRTGKMPSVAADLKMANTFISIDHQPCAQPINPGVVERKEKLSGIHAPLPLPAI